MRVRPSLVVPPVVLAAGCVSEPWTPGAGVTHFAQPPEPAQIVLPGRDEAVRRWQLPAGDPWAPYAKYTLLSALDAVSRPIELPDVRSLEEVRLAAAAGYQVGAEGLPAGTIFVVDMRGAASVAFGVALSRAARQSVSVVPTFNNWPGEEELVPAEETLAALATMTPQLPADGGASSGPVFLLDSWRLAYRHEEPGEATYDNRYILTPGDLPDVESLRIRGVQRLVYVVEDLDETSVEEDDLNAVFFGWQQAGMKIAMLDLARLEQPMDAALWNEAFVEDALLVKPRRTVLEDPAFYVLARGGFGGVWAQPSPLWSGGVWIGGGGWHGWHGGGG
jgi:hypothetical protein